MPEKELKDYILGHPVIIYSGIALAAAGFGWTVKTAMLETHGQVLILKTEKDVLLQKAADYTALQKEHVTLEKEYTQIQRESDQKSIENKRLSERLKLSEKQHMSSKSDTTALNEKIVAQANTVESLLQKLEEVQRIDAPLLENTKEMEGGDLTVIDLTTPNKNEIVSGGAFADDFSKGPDSRWSEKLGKWTMLNGKLTIRHAEEKKNYGVLLTQHSWNNLSISVDVGSGDCGIRCITIAKVCPKVWSDKDKICFSFIGKDNFRYLGFNFVGWSVTENGIEGQVIGSKPYSLDKMSETQLKIEVYDGLYRAFLDGKFVSEYYDDNAGIGGIGLYQRLDVDADYDIVHPMTFDNVSVVPK